MLLEIYHATMREMEKLTAALSEMGDVNAQRFFAECLQKIDVLAVELQRHFAERLMSLLELEPSDDRVQIFKKQLYRDWYKTVHRVYPEKAFEWPGGG